MTKELSVHAQCPYHRGNRCFDIRSGQYIGHISNIEWCNTVKQFVFFICPVDPDDYKVWGPEGIWYYAEEVDSPEGLLTDGIVVGQRVAGQSIFAPLDHGEPAPKTEDLDMLDESHWRAYVDRVSN